MLMKIFIGFYFAFYSTYYSTFYSAFWIEVEASVFMLGILLLASRFSFQLFFLTTSASFTGFIYVLNSVIYNIIVSPSTIWSDYFGMSLLFHFACFSV